MESSIGCQAPYGAPKEKGPPLRPVKARRAYPSGAPVELADVQDAVGVLISEGLAQLWADKGDVWCGR
ncbi:hypothetical protein NPA31_005295 [Aurantimonas sp. MSK8Z-1]|uniref:hypothetical protein n=1 Tax=Mangrovibrevibacter kandeliae TaxID=2968473 RepID=UPI002117C845|nr:hypothetical protein [Aurantimonas sp. MSK8Z-1]MCW4114377.1 hypothetical protein [Aurantimonas sp. MSK8Z-1]